MPKVRSKKATARTRLRLLKAYGLKCCYCGYDRLSGLEFHHVLKHRHKKKFNLSVKGMRDKSREEIRHEVSICQLVCRNCHSAIHAGELQER